MRISSNGLIRNGVIMMPKKITGRVIKNKIVDIPPSIVI
jgi:hypothetical protein